MRAVIDSNILVSALLNPSGTPTQVLAAYRAGRFAIVTSEPLGSELARVLGREKFARRGVTPEMVAELLDLLRGTAEMVTAEGTLGLCRDPKDDVVIETAVNGHADVVVTGDRDLTSMDEVTAYLGAREIRVLSVRLFLQALQLLETDQMMSPLADSDP